MRRELSCREFVPPNGLAIRLKIDSETAADATFVGVAPRIDALVAHVTCPDGSRLDPATANIEVTCYDAVCHASTPPADAWRKVPVRVRIVRDGCEPYVYLWTAATADAEHRLVATRPESSK